ncbi:MucR family transcriptional regulator [Nitrospirillum sp. BR 11163]|uniref:MucR family transcriptional regulator n=1 Tax=Nitrospirillum sp. BR 11163 TaxID=3104323 RepID=UPI002AFF2131|nr:MucR family transcriptional regulator [Nitrospirillum sp. BR 11163]MEA1675470.1 MucR family transcriptional regulator [Nitrospirillum sp. BR 11163]
MTEFLEETAAIVASYVAGNQIPATELPGLIRTVHGGLQALTAPPQPAPEPEKLTPAVPVRRSVTPEYIICLEDGKRLKMLKRHLRTAYGLTPEEYREKWGLPADYPRTAPNYAGKRSKLATQAGLGTRKTRAK